MRNAIFFRALAIGVTVCIAASCAHRPTDLSAAPRGVSSGQVGSSVNGLPIQLWTLGEGGETILFIASIHGSENKGTSLMRDLAEHLVSNPDIMRDRKVAIVPVVNPDGFAVEKRFNANGVDLNRNFPAFNRENSRRYGMSALSEPEAQAIRDVLEMTQPARIVSMHEPLNCVDWDGPGESLARHMGLYCDLPVERVGSRPGSLGSYAGETLGIPIITFELPEEARRMTPKERWAAYGASLVAAVSFPDAPE